MPENKAQDQRLGVLWEHRAELTQADYPELYRMVHAILTTPLHKKPGAWPE
jgi:hypothetical protein